MNQAQRWAQYRPVAERLVESAILWSMSKLSRPYDGPPTCRDRSTWVACRELCDGCGERVDFLVWRSNKRHCSPGCRPAWHLVPAQACKFPGCGERIIREEGKGRPQEYCSDDCRREARAEDKRRSRAGEPSIDRELRGNEAVFADWMPRRSDMDAGWEDSFLVENQYGQPLQYERESDWGLPRWRRHGGDWPGMVSGMNRPAIRDGKDRPTGWKGNTNPRPSPALGSWEPWNTVL